MTSKKWVITDPDDAHTNIEGLEVHCYGGEHWFNAEDARRIVDAPSKALQIVNSAISAMMVDNLDAEPVPVGVVGSWLKSIREALDNDATL